MDNIKMTEETTRIAVRLNQSLAAHVARQIGPGGLYDNASEFIRDLIRRDALKSQEDPKEALYELLAMGALADETAFRQTTLDHIRQLAKERFE